MRRSPSAAPGWACSAGERADSVERARLLTLECRIHHQQGQFEQAIEDGQRALAIVEDTSHYQEIAQAHNELGNAFDQFGQPDRGDFSF